MKTISTRNDSVGTIVNPHGLLTAAGVWNLHTHRAPVEWLPAPAAPPRQNAVNGRGSASRTPGFWISLPADPAFEKGMLGLLVLAGVIGIGYGFSCLVDLVQHWALVNVSIGRMIN